MIINHLRCDECKKEMTKRDGVTLTVRDNDKGQHRWEWHLCDNCFSPLKERLG